MVQYFPIVTGSLIVSGSITATEGISMSGSIASASFAANAATASFVTLAQTASFVANAQSASNAVAAQTASYANTFTVAGNLTAQTLVVQTITSSVDFVTGSTQFGSISSNTHQFTGSVSITGSLTSNGAFSGTSATFSGNVGLGGAASSDRLTISGSDYNNAAYFLGGSTTGASYGLQIRAGSNSTDYALLVQSRAGGEYFRVRGDGNVGIGTTSPGARLHVSGSVEANGSLYRAIFGAAVQDADMTGLSGGNGSEVQIQAGSSTRGAFLTLGGGMATSEAMGGIAFYNSNNTDGKRLRAYLVGGQEGATTNEQGGYLSFGTVANAGTIPSERMRITSDSRVGIGTSTPSGSRLHVFIGNDGGSGIPGVILATSNGANDIVRFQDGTTTVAVVKNDGRFGMGTTNTSTEANLHLGANGASEGGQLVLQKATSYASASHLDNYQNRFRVLSGTDTTSSAERFSVDMTNGNTTATGRLIGTGFKSYSGEISIASGASSNIYAMQDNGLYTAQIIVAGGSLIYSAAAIFYAHNSNSQYIKTLDLYDGANVTLDNSGTYIRITNNGFSTFTWNWSIIFQAF